jgi:hypothetical protein
LREIKANPHQGNGISVTTHIFPNKGEELVLSDPVILSRTGDYGVTDLGRDGISSFFSQHDCNQHCRPNWTKPATPRLPPWPFLPVSAPVIWQDAAQ